MSIEVELLQAEQRKLEVEIAGETPSFEVEKLLAWVDGHDTEDAVRSARQLLDIEPLIYKRAGELAERVRVAVHLLAANGDATSLVFKLRTSAMEALHRELRDVCLINITLNDTRRRFLAAWDSLWPNAT